MNPESSRRETFPPDEARERAVELGDEGRQKQLRRSREASADHDETIEERDGVGNGVAGHFAEPPEGFPGRRFVSGRFPTRDRRDHARLRRGVRRDAGLARVDASDGADADPVLGREIAVELVPDEPDLPGRAVVADEELAVPHDAGAEAGAERDAEEVAVAPGASRLREHVG